MAKRDGTSRQGEGQQQLAEEKGITKRKRSKLAFDEPTQDWRRRHGYGKANGVNDLAIVEAKRGGLRAPLRSEEDRAGVRAHSSGDRGRQPPAPALTAGGA